MKNTTFHNILQQLGFGAWARHNHPESHTPEALLLAPPKLGGELSVFREIASSFPAGCGASCNDGSGGWREWGLGGLGSLNIWKGAFAEKVCFTQQNTTIEL